MNSFVAYSSIFGGRFVSPRRHKRNARAWALHRSALGASLPCPSLASLSFLGKSQRMTRLARRRGTADFTDFEQIKGVLAHAGRRRGSLEAWRLGSLDRPHAARLSQRTRRTTVQARSDKPSTAGTKWTARRRGRAVRSRKAHVRPGDLGGMAGFARHALGEGALTRPGEQRTENGEQRARGKRATVKPLCVSGVGHRPVVLQRRSSGDSGDSGDSGAPLWGDGWRRQGAKPMGGRERSAGV